LCLTWQTPQKGTTSTPSGPSRGSTPIPPSQAARTDRRRTGPAAAVAALTRRAGHLEHPDPDPTPRSCTWPRLDPGPLSGLAGSGSRKPTRRSLHCAAKTWAPFACKASGRQPPAIITRPEQPVPQPGRASIRVQPAKPQVTGPRIGTLSSLLIGRPFIEARRSGSAAGSTAPVAALDRAALHRGSSDPLFPGNVTRRRRLHGQFRSQCSMASGIDNSCPSGRMPQPQLSIGGVRSECS
jgi:hypothetical protein